MVAASLNSWFKAFRPSAFGPMVTDIATAWINQTTKREFVTSASNRFMSWLGEATPFEKYLVTEAATLPLGPLGEVLQLKMLRRLGVTNLKALRAATTATQQTTLVALAGAAYVGLGLTTYKAARRAFAPEEEAPTRYKKAYSRLHTMQAGAPFFGSGAKTDAILDFGAANLARPRTPIRDNNMQIAPHAGGLPQELNRQANTHHLIGRAATDFNARLFKI